MPYRAVWLVNYQLVFCSVAQGIFNKLFGILPARRHPAGFDVYFGLMRF
jgi:hypothetical protein